MKTDLFQSRGHCWLFQTCWHIECSPFIASSFRIWNSSTGIPSPPLALFVVMLPKGHLTSHSRMSGSGSVITPSWLSGLWRSLFVQFFCVFFLIRLHSFIFLALSPEQSLGLVWLCTMLIGNYAQDISGKMAYWPHGPSGSLYSVLLLFFFFFQPFMYVIL